jgi:hypothetical protein
MIKKSSMLLIAAATLSSVFISCKKDNSSASSEIETTFDLANKQSISEGIVEDANDLLEETVESANLSGAREPLVCSGTASCAQVTVSPGGFPKTITLDFGTSGCTSNNGITRSGIIHILLSDSLRRPGSTATMTFDNYFVNGYHKEGTITWTNTSAPGTRSWHRDVANGRLTAPDGRTWTHTSSKDIVQVAGLNTPRVLIDDAFSITGTATTTNAAGVTRNSEILTPLHKQVSCPHVDQGSVKHQGPNHFAIVDFGNGTCDNIATVSIDGYAPRTITLP